jgi:hypothetical protein
MNKRIAKNVMMLLERVTLRGSEVKGFIEAMSALEQIIQADQTVGPPLPDTPPAE